MSNDVAVCVGRLGILPAIVPIHGERHRELLGRSLGSPREMVLWPQSQPRGVVDGGGVGSESVETVAQCGDSMEVENLLGANLETPSTEAGVTVASISAAVVVEGGGISPKSVEAVLGL